MGWGLGFDEKHQRDVGYMVPSHCDHPGCRRVIDRGLSYVCGGEPYGGDEGCGLYFCGAHLGYEFYKDEKGNWKIRGPQKCERCIIGDSPFDFKPDHKTWTRWKMKHWSWWKWRAEEGIPEPKRILKPDEFEINSRDYMVYLRECVGK